MLDLETWSSRRFWPTTPFERTLPGEGIEKIADVLTATMKARRRPGVPKPNVAITAGFDSRALLACSRGCRDRMRFFTAALPDLSGRIDARAAPRLAAQFGARVPAPTLAPADDA